MNVAVVLEPGDAAVAVLAEDEPALRVDQQAVRARLAAPAGVPGVAARLEEDADPLALLPLEDGVRGTSEKSRKPPRAIPDRPLGPVEPVGEPLDPGVCGDDPVEPRVEPLDRAERGRAPCPGAEARATAKGPATASPARRPQPTRPDIDRR